MKTRRLVSEFTQALGASEDGERGTWVLLSGWLL